MGVLIFFAVCIAIGVWLAIAKMRRESVPNPVLVCPHCQTRGQVTAHAVTTKDGISGGKATGAILTGGASMLATGLSRKSARTRMVCGNCGTDWLV